MTNRHSALIAAAAVFTLACSSTPEPSTPAPAEAQPPAAQTPPAQTPAQTPATSGTLSDERAMELARGYVALLHAGNYAQLWEHVAPAGQARFETLERFQSEGERVMNELGPEVGVVSEVVEAPRAGMQADKVYLRVSRYERAPGPVRLALGLMNDGTIIGMQVRPAE